MDKKYSFFDLKRSKQLPENVNEFLVEFAKRLKSEDLEKRLESIRSRRQYGRLRVFDKHGIEVLNAPFRAGVCKKADVNDFEGVPLQAPFLVSFNRSLMNPLVSFERGEKEEPEE